MTMFILFGFVVAVMFVMIMNLIISMSFMMTPMACIGHRISSPSMKTSLLPILGIHTSLRQSVPSNGNVSISSV